MELVAWEERQQLWSVIGDGVKSAGGVGVGVGVVVVKEVESCVLVLLDGRSGGLVLVGGGSRVLMLVREGSRVRVLVGKGSRVDVEKRLEYLIMRIGVVLASSYLWKPVDLSE